MVPIKCWNCGKETKASRRKVNAAMYGKITRTLDPDGWVNSNTPYPLCFTCSEDNEVWHRLHDLLDAKRKEEEARDPEGYRNRLYASMG